jgi:hypothetical protein
MVECGNWKEYGNSGPWYGLDLSPKAPGIIAYFLEIVNIKLKNIFWSENVRPDKRRFERA